jgi:hypothetical protein
VKESFTKGVRFAREKTAKKAIASVRAKEKRKKNAQLRKIAAIAKAKNAKEHAKKELNKKHALAKTLQSQAKQLAKAAGVHGRKYVRIAKQSLKKFLFAHKHLTASQMKTGALKAVRAAQAAMHKGTRRKAHISKKKSSSSGVSKKVANAANAVVLQASSGASKKVGNAADAVVHEAEATANAALASL